MNENPRRGLALWERLSWAPLSLPLQTAPELLPCWQIKFQDKATSLLPPVPPYLLHNDQDLMTQAQHNSHNSEFYQNTMTNTNVWPSQKSKSPLASPSAHQFKLIVSHYSPLQALLYREPFPTKNPDSCWKWGKENGARGLALCWIFNTSPCTGDNYLLMDCSPSSWCPGRSGFSGRIILFPCNCLAPVFLISISIFNIPH